MHPAYYETHFRQEGGWDDWPSEFAIITAYSPTGDVWTETENQRADHALETELRGLAQWVRRLTGYSPTTNHAEPGWAVAIGFEEACKIGGAFKQDAIYYVRGNEISVSHCAPARLEKVSEFRSRVHQVR